MKKTILILTMVIAIILGCKKPETYCWNCSTLHQYEINGDTTTIPDANGITFCDSTENDISAYEALNSFTKPVPLYDKVYTLIITTKCKIKNN
jgi:hypothetical protein